MDKKNKSTNSKLDDLAGLKEILTLNGNMMEFLKTVIKQRNNENALKMLDIISEKPDVWHEYLAYGILYQNLPVVKHMLETFGIDPKQVPVFNPSVLDYNADKISHESFTQVECPIVIQAGIGGDVEIFKYLYDKGFIPKLDASGHIAISRKNKNSLHSNIIGAAAYHGRDKLLCYLLEKCCGKNDNMINFRTIEKKIKTRQGTHLLKEYIDATPAHLAIVGDSSEQTSMKMLLTLNEFKADLASLDNNKNNLLHYAVKGNKLLVVKFLMEELKLDFLSNQINKEGQTPVAIAQGKMGEYLQKFVNSANNVENDLLELIAEDTNKKKKQKKNKNKTKNDFPGLLNSTEYQETLKITNQSKKADENKVETPETINEAQGEGNVVTNTGKEEVQENPSDQISYEPRYERKSYYTENYYDKPKKSYYKNNNTYRNNNYRSRYYDTDKHYKDNYRYNRTHKDYSISRETHSEDVQDAKPDGQSVTPQEDQAKAHTQDYQHSDKSEGIPNEHTDKAHVLNLEDQVDYDNDDDQEQNFLEEEDETKEGKQLSQTKSPLKITPSSPMKPKETQGNVSNQSINNLMEKLLVLEKENENLKRENSELRHLLLTKPNRAEDEIPNTQQNIHDLLSLTNEELEQKSRRIAELEKKLELVELTQVKDMSISQLNASRDYLSTKLGIVIDATNNLNVKT